MRRRGLRMAALGLLAGLGIAGALLWEPRFPVVGELSDAELRQIRTGVLRRAKNPFVVPNGVAGWRGWATALMTRFRTRILLVERRTDGFVVVKTGVGSDPDAGGVTFWSVFLEKGTWRVGSGTELGAEPKPYTPPGKTDGKASQAW